MQDYKEYIVSIEDLIYEQQLLIKTLERKAVSLEPQSTTYACTVDCIMQARKEIRRLNRALLDAKMRHVKRDIPEPLQ